MEILDHWEFSFLATELVFFVTEIPGLIDPLPSYGCPGDDVSESFIEDNNPKWTSKVKILGVSTMHAKNHHDSESEISHPLGTEPIGKKRSKLYDIFKPKGQE